MIKILPHKRGKNPNEINRVFTEYYALLSKIFYGSLSAFELSILEIYIADVL